MIVMVLIFAALAFLVPNSWVKRFNTVIAPNTIKTSTVFEDSTADLDVALSAGTIKATQRDALKRARAAIQVRRIATAGPMTNEDFANTLKHLREANPQVDREPSPASRQAMNREISRRAARAIPRLKSEDVVRAMDAFDEQYVRAMGIEFK